MELVSNSTTPIITPQESNCVNPNLTNSPVTPNATLTGSNKNTNIEKLSLCNCHSDVLNINFSKNDILKVEAQLSALKSYVNCKLSALRKQVQSFTEHTKMSLCQENRNIDAYHNNIALLKKELPEKNKTIKSLVETERAVLNVLTDSNNYRILQNRS